MKRTCLFLPIFLLLSLVTLGSVKNASAEGRINLQAIMSKRVPVLLEFGRGWCKPCKYMKPILEDMAKMYAGKAIVTTVDMDANKDLVRSFRIRMMPTQVFLLPDGKEFFRNEGTLERQQIAHVFAKMGCAPPIQTRPQAQAVPQPQVPRMPVPVQR
jgi:thioredoxin-like negative regulator of GroEL